MSEPFSIVKYPTSILRKKTKKVNRITGEHQKLFKDMLEIMYKNKGIGLAAPQVGVALQLAVVNAGDGLLKIANPAIVKKEGIDVMDEGCLSIPQTLVKVKRSKTITIEYINEEGEKIKKTFDGLTAKAIQHEIDHLNGRLIIDYLPWYKRVFMRKSQNGYVRR